MTTELSGVDITQIDGALGVSGDSSGDVFAVFGTATAGAVNYPVSFMDPADIKAYFGSGPLVEHACYLAGGKPVVCVRMTTVTPGSCGTIDVTGALGTSVATIHSGAAADQEYDIVVECLVGGTLGVAGIVLRYSKDGGYTWSENTALGTALTFIVPNSGGVQLDFAAGTMLLGSVYKTRTVAPKEDAAGVALAQTALRTTHHQWDAFHVATVQDASGLALWDAFCADLWTKKLRKKGVCFVRGQNIGETNADWQIVLAAIRAAFSTIYLAVCAGYERKTSRRDGSRYRLPNAVSFSKRACGIPRPSRTDLAETNLGAIPDSTLFDRLGALAEHNEAEFPGLDAMKYVVCRTHAEGGKGTYFEKPNIFCSPGSDYYLWQYRSVANRVADAVGYYLWKRLRGPLQVNKTTGFLKNTEASDIDDGGMKAISSTVSAGPDCSDYKFTVSRTDDLLAQGSQCHVAVRIVPLAYVNKFGITLGFVNPARGVL